MNTINNAVKNVVVLWERMRGEGRVALMPTQCAKLVGLGHKVYVEAGAGVKSGFEDADYVAAGAHVLSVTQIIPLLQSPNTVVLKVKQPLPEDDVWFKEMKNGVLCTFFHSTGETNSRTIDILLENNITALSYELIQEDNGVCPILIPMSKIAGRLAVQQGRELLVKARKSAALSEVPKEHICMMVIGAGSVGLAAVWEGVDLGFSEIKVFDKDSRKAQILFEQFPPEKRGKTSIKFFSTIYDDKYLFTNALESAHIVVGAAQVSGGHAPIVVSEEEFRRIPRGSVVVDVAVDQGGCITCPKGDQSIFWYGKQMLYICRIPNMPGSVPKEATPALTESFFPYLLEILGDEGLLAVVRSNGALQKGVITHGGKVMNMSVAEYYKKPLYRFTDSAERLIF